MTVTTSTLPDGRGAVHVDELHDTDVEDLWQACTDPERLARWIAVVTGDLRPGSTVTTVWSSSWTGTVRIEVCDRPHHLLLTTQPGTDEEGSIEVRLTAEGDRTRLVIDDRGVPADELPFHGAGWQVHVEDLAAALRTAQPVHPEGWSSQAPAPRWIERWRSLQG